MINARSDFTIVGLGEILWDLLPDSKQLGGAPANFAYHAQSLGGSSYVVSAVGDDDLGHELLGLLNVLGLNQQYIALDKKHSTGTVSVELDEEGKPEFIIHEDVAWDYIPSSPEILKLAARTDAVCFGTLAQRSTVSRRTIYKFLQSTRPDCVRVFDVNLRQSFFNERLIQDMLKVTDVLKLNDEELLVIAKICSTIGSETEILRKLLEKFELQLIALTKGKNGSRLITLESDSNQMVQPLGVVDTVGAGDAFTAAMIMGLLRQLPLEIIHEHAASLAAFVCTKKGATPQLSEELKEKIVNV